MKYVVNQNNGDDKVNKEMEEILIEMDLVVNHDKVPIYFTQNQVKTTLLYIEQLEKEKEKLQSNWNSLREYVTTKDNAKIFGVETGKTLQFGIELGFKSVLDKMEKLEGGDK